MWGLVGLKSVVWVRGFRVYGSGFRVWVKGSVGSVLVGWGSWDLCECGGTEADSYLRLIDFCITQLKAQGPSRTCNESQEEEEEEEARGHAGETRQAERLVRVQVSNGSAGAGGPRKST